MGRSLRSLLLAGCSVFLLCGGVGLLALTALRNLRPDDGDGTAPVAQATIQAANPAAGEQALDGKLLPTAGSPAGFPAVPQAIQQQTVPERAERDFDTLFKTIAPVHDYFAAAEELGGLALGQRTTAAPPHQIGDRATFNTADGLRQAELVYVDELAAYWVEAGLTLDRPALVAAAERLRDDYYPMLVQTVGQEWRPGVDGDPRFTVLAVLGSPETHELGYFTDENEYPRTLFPESNEREMVYLNMAQLQPGPLYDGTLVHEVQHLIQWNLDANEDKWFNEGLSQVIETRAGLNTVDPRPFLEQPNLRLDRWADIAPDLYAHYAGSYLYLLYLWEQLGDAALTEVARQPANGLAAARAVLAGFRPGQSLESFTADWATALYLDGESSDPRFAIRHHELSPPFFANRVRQMPFEAVSSLDQYAIDYVDLDFSGPATITFAGDSTTSLLGAPEGEPFWYAPPVNSGRSQLTAAVDLSQLSSPSLSFSAWYDLEAGYDFAYLSVSADGGQTWRLLEPDHLLLGAYGPAWGGRSAAADQSNGWLDETIDLSAYAGQSILLRFDVVTDFEEFGRGFALSDLTIPQLVEQPVWRPNGFVETGDTLPQRWEVRVIREGQTPEVIPLVLDALSRGQSTVDLGSEGGVLVVMPLTPFVESAADYWLSVSRP